ncbi:hypothetical protein BGX28_010483 [Mortierella sp. GBA30]|nr:hypothetical protein BGX28_010483 [Mortierella sp. GBA30]
MTLERTQEEKHPRSVKGISPSLSTAVAPGILRASSRSPSSSSLHSRPVTRLRYRQLVQPITPTELEPAPEAEQTQPSTASSQTDGAPLGSPISPSATVMRYPRVPLSSLDLAKPRIYTRLLYFFDANSGTPTSTSMNTNTSKSTNQSTNTSTSTDSSGSSTTQGSFLPVVDPSSSSSTGTREGATPSTASSQKSFSPSQIPQSTQHKKHSSRSSRLHYHYNESPFMDPMLLQASLALVLSDFFPLAGRLCNSSRQASSSAPAPSTAAATGCSSLDKRPFIECNDRGVLFAVADTSANMHQIQQGQYQDSILPPQLFPVGLYPASLRDPPLLGIQLTYTQDQSLIMGVAMDSSVMDAKSLVKFMEAWSKITQGKDFSPFPILDRSFVEKLGTEGTNSAASHSNTSHTAVYRHQRINNSPPPPILFDNNLDNDLDRGLGDSDHATEDDENDSDSEEDEDKDYDDEDKEQVADEDTEGRSNLERTQRRLEAIQDQHPRRVVKETGKRVAHPPSVTVHYAEQHLDGSAEDIPELYYRTVQTVESLDTAEMETGPGTEPEIGTDMEGGTNLRLFHFSPEQLDRIKKLASEQNIAAAACAADDKEISDKWVSMGDSLIAYLWKMSTITRRMEPDCKLMCGLVMDIRNRVTPIIPEGFIGNAILSIFVQMPVHSLLTTPLSLPSRLLRDELILQTPEQIRSAISWIQKQDNPHLIETASNNPFGYDFMVWSFRKLDMYSPDFGQGRPCKVRIGRGGFGGGEGMCVIMESEPPGTGTGAGIEETGVDVYMGLQGEHLLDFEKVHRGFMEGLVGTGGSSSNGWEMI